MRKQGVSRWLAVIATCVQLPCYLLAAETDSPVERVFLLKVQDQRVALDMRVIRVKQGETVRLRWTSDRPLKLHLHGYDIEHAVTPGTVTEFSFKAYATSRFPINVHTRNQSRGHGHSEHVLVYLEVHPR